MKSHTRLGTLGFQVLCFALLCLPAIAQRNTGTIVGLITDSTGAALPNATVTVTNVDTGVIRTQAAENTGNYRVVSLPPGNYKVTAGAPGFSTQESEGIALQVDDDQRVDFAMKVGNTAESITVTAGAPLVQTENGELGTTLESQQIQDMPNAGRNILATLPLLSPGVGQARQNYDNDPPMRFSVNGGRALSEDMTVDGAEAISVNIEGWNFYKPNEDEVQEMKFQTNAYAAENGRGSASVNIITKSGTNQFHGSAYDFNRQTALNANEWFNKRNQLAKGLPNRPNKLRDNLYGGTVGGPVLKNKLFFFMLYERDPTSNKANARTSVPTAAFKGGDFSALLNFATPIVIYDPATTVLNPAFDSTKAASATNPQYLRTPFPGNMIPSGRFDPVAVNVLKFLPDPNSTDINNPTGQDAAFNNDYTNANTGTNVHWHINPRIDYSINKKQTIFFRLTHDSNVNQGAGVFPGFSPIDNNRGVGILPTWATTFGYTYLLNDHLINDFRMGVERDVNATTYPGSGKNYAGQLGVKNSNAENFPIFNFGVDSAGYGGGPGNALNQWEQTIQWTDAVTYLVGKHAFKFGGDLRFNQVNKQTGRNNPSGQFQFSGVFTSPDTWNMSPTGATASMADFLLGQVTNYAIQPADFIWGARKKEASWFAQDDWKISSKLTLNLGVRQDLQFTWKEVNNRYTAFSPTLINPSNGLPGALAYGIAATNGTKLWNFAPRVGFAWTPFADQKTVVRGGAGRFISPASTIEDYGDTGQGEELGYSASASATTNNPLAPAFLMQNGGPLAVRPLQSPGANSNTPGLNDVGFSPLFVDTGEGTPIVYAWNVTAARELPAHTVVELSYVGSRANHLPFERNINVIPLAKAVGQTSIVWSNMPYPQYGGVNGRFHDGNSTFNSLQLKVVEKLSSNLNWTFGYTLAKSMDNSSLDPTISWGGASWNGSGVQNIYNLRANWARSSFDQRQKMSMSFQYQLPIGYRQKFLNQGVVGRAIGGWQINAMMQAHTGQTIEFTNPVNFSQTGNQIQRPNCVSGQSFKNSHPTIQNWWNWSAFTENTTPNTYGNCGRDLSAVPGYQEVDMSAFKNTSFKTPLNENTVLQFRMEAFNALNRVNFGLPNAGVPLNTCTSSSCSSFGQIGGSVGDPRQITAALKLIF